MLTFKLSASLLTNTIMEAFASLRSYAALIGSNWRFGATCRSQNVGKYLKIRAGNIVEERRYHLHRDGSLKSDKRTCSWSS